MLRCARQDRRCERDDRRPSISGACGRQFGSRSSTSRSQPGDYILNHVGYAIRRIPAEEIGATLALYEELLARADERARPDGGRRAREKSRVRPMRTVMAALTELKFRDPARARALSATLARAGRRDRPRTGFNHARLRQPRAGDRQVRPARGAAARARRHHGARLPGLHHRRAGGGRGRRAGPAGRADRHLWRHGQGARHGHVARRRASRRRRVSTSSTASSQAVDLARAIDEPLVFFATGFETTAVATAAAAAQRPACRTSSCSRRTNTSRRSWRSSRRCPTPASKASLPLAMRRRSPAGVSSSRSSSAIKLPVVVAGFEPLDILAGLAKLVELIRAPASRGREHVSALRDAGR